MLYVQLGTYTFSTSLNVIYTSSIPVVQTGTVIKSLNYVWHPKIRVTPGIHICLVESCKVKQSINQLVGHGVRKKSCRIWNWGPSRAGIFSYIRHSIYHVGLWGQVSVFNELSPAIHMACETMMKSNSSLKSSGEWGTGRTRGTELWAPPLSKPKRWRMCR